MSSAPNPSNAAMLTNTMALYAINPIAMSEMTVISLRMSRPPTKKIWANEMGQPLISARILPVAEERIRSKDLAKW